MMIYVLRYLTFEVVEIVHILDVSTLFRCAKIGKYPLELLCDVGSLFLPFAVAFEYFA